MRSPVYPPVEYDTRLATAGCHCLRASENSMEESVARVQDRDKSLKCWQKSVCCFVGQALEPLSDFFPAQSRFQCHRHFPNPKAVPDAKISTSIPFTSPSKRRPRGVTDRPFVPVTPVKTYLTGYFTPVLQPKQREPRKQPRQRMKPSFHGEVWTQDFLTYWGCRGRKSCCKAEERNQRWQSTEKGNAW